MIIIKIIELYPFYQRLNYKCPDDGDGSFKCDDLNNEKIDKMSSLIKSIEQSKEPIKMDYETFKAKTGLVFPGDDHGMLRMPHGISKTDERRREKLMTEWGKNSDLTRKQYNKFVEDGKIIKPTTEEKLIATSEGMEELAAVQAAKRVLEKRKQRMMK